jgi:CBS-domain-containing membrane protein
VVVLSEKGKPAGVLTRRLVVVDDEGRLVGILALDDVLELLAEEFTSGGRRLQRRKAAHQARRRTPRRFASREAGAPKKNA